jgi:hypothetical protein
MSKTSKFWRVNTVSANEAEYAKLADEHFSRICSGIPFTHDFAILEIGRCVGRLFCRCNLIGY